MTTKPTRASPYLLVLLGALALAPLGAQDTTAGDTIRPDADLVFLAPDGRVVTHIRVEIADDPASRVRGLMGRLLPGDDSGMLFVYPKAVPQRFWMRNTPGSLDMLFADTERRIFRIVRETPPMSDQIHTSGEPAMYVIETRAGFAERHGIVPGSSFAYERIPVTRRPQAEVEIIRTDDRK